MNYQKMIEEYYKETTAKTIKKLIAERLKTYSKKYPQNKRDIALYIVKIRKEYGV